MGFALGVGGLSFDDFCLLTPDEFQAVLDAYSEAEERHSHDMWECMRILAAISVSPFSKSRVDPKNLLKFPWEEQTAAKIVSKEDDIMALQRLMSRLKK